MVAFFHLALNKMSSEMILKDDEAAEVMSTSSGQSLEQVSTDADLDHYNKRKPQGDSLAQLLLAVAEGEATDASNQLTSTIAESGLDLHELDIEQVQDHVLKKPEASSPLKEPPATVERTEATTSRQLPDSISAEQFAATSYLNTSSSVSKSNEVVEVALSDMKQLSELKEELTAPVPIVKNTEEMPATGISEKFTPVTQETKKTADSPRPFEEIKELKTMACGQVTDEAIKLVSPTKSSANYTEGVSLIEPRFATQLDEISGKLSHVCRHVPLSIFS